MVEHESWIDRVLRQPGTSGHVAVPGARLHFLEWPGPEGAPDLLLLHGFRAHAHWWDFIAPLLATQFRVIALDLGGMGDSGRRPAYCDTTYAREIVDVIEALPLRAPIVVGHSFGGMMALTAASMFPGRMARLILIDAHISFPDNHDRSNHPPARAPRHYADAPTLLRHFRLMPDQAGVDPVIFEHVARHSIKRDDTGWTWKFDPICAGPSIAAAPRYGADMLRELSVPVDYVYGEHSLIITPAFAARIAACLPCGRGPIAIPAAQHHVLLDQPLALAAALIALLTPCR